MQDSPRTARFGLKLGLYGLLALGLVFATGCDDDTPPPADMGQGGEGGTPVGGMGGTPMGGMGGVGGGTGSPCLGEDECPTGQYCDIEDGAFSGECRDGCNDEDDCAAGQECNTQTNVCGAPGCDGDADCPDGRCDETGACVDSDCSSERACDADGDGRPQQCNEDDGTCAPLFACCAGEGMCSMALDGECPEDAMQLADTVTCDDNPCGSSCTRDSQGADCAMNEFCNEDTNRCQEGCRLEAASCPDGESCDAETRECAPRPCVGMEDCNSYQFCDDIVQVCADGCQSDDDCPRDGEICDGGECIERCDVDEVGACGEGEYCSPVTATCREECDEHSDCEGNEACNPVNNECEESACRDDLGDGAEPNNDEATATIIDMGEPDADGIRSGGADGRVLCGDDVDVFAVTLRQAERMRIRLVFDENEDLNFRLSGEEVGDEPIVVATAQAPEELFFPGENDVRNETTYYITVYPGRAAREGLGYSLEIIAFDTQTVCLPDALEDNDDAETATVIGNANPYDADELTICGQDSDWFTRPLALNSGMRVEVITNGDEPPMTIGLYSQGRIDGIGGGGPEYDDVVAEDRAGRVAYIIDIPAETGAFSDGNWYIRVGSSDPASRSQYTINVRVEGGPPCVDDGYEDNDGVAGGTDLAGIDGVGANGEVPYSEDGIEIPSPGDEPLQICTFDDDYYCLDLEAGDRLEAWAQSNTVAGEVRVRIVDSDGRNVGAEGLLVGEEANPIPAELLGALEGRYCVVVDGQGAAQGPYRFWVRRVAVADLCQEDPELAEGVNNTADTATPLVDIESMLAPNRRFEYRNALICGNEDDWYEFNVAERRSRVCVMVDGFRQDNADIDIELFRTQGGLGQDCNRTADCDPGTHCISGVCRASIEASETEYDSEQISVGKRIIGNNDGEYKLRVFRGADGDDSAYRVLATVTPEDEVCGPDWQERAAGANENADQAIDLGQGQASLCDTWLCHDGDQDYYRFVVPAGQDRTVFIEYANQDDGRIFMDITGTELDGDPDFGGFRRSADPAGDHQCVNLRGGAEDQEVFVRLFGNLELPDGDDRVDYSLRIVPTDLGDLNPGNPQANMEQGECVTLGGSELGSCPFDNPFADDCWPHMDLE